LRYFAAGFRDRDPKQRSVSLRGAERRRNLDPVALAVLWRKRHRANQATSLQNHIERRLPDRARRFVKAELKRAEVSYAELARRLKEHGLEETEASITAKLNRGTFAATFFLATMKAIGQRTVNLEDI
jgi:hypothetical protein